MRAGRRRPGFGGLLGAFVCALVLVTAGCGGSSGHSVSSKSFELYTWTGYVPAALVKGFEDRYHLAVHVTYYASNEEMLKGVEAHPGKYDLVIPSDYAVEIMRERGLLEPIDVVKDIHNFDNVLDDFRAPFFDPGATTQQRRGKQPQSKYTVPYEWGTTGIAYDSAKVPKPPREWADLARPEFRGKIALIDDAREVLGAALIAAGHSKQDTNPADLAAALAWVKALDPLPVDPEHPLTALVQGKAIVAVTYNGDAAQAIRKRPSLRYVLPSNGGIWFDNMAIPKDAPHRDAALAFIDYVLEGKVGAQIPRVYGYSTPNRAALDELARTDPSFANNTVTNPPRDALQGLLLTKNVGQAGSDRFDQAWKEIRG